MSEEEPEDNSGPVYYVTGKNFANLIAQTDKHSKFKQSLKSSINCNG